MWPYTETPAQTDARHATEATDALVARLRRQIAEQAAEIERLRAHLARYQAALSGSVE